MAGKLIILISVAVLSNGAVVPAVPAALPAALPAAKLEELDASPQYSFAYDVQDALTGDSKAQYETRNGDLVQGSYSLIEADGTRRIVEYTADPINGFNAVVSREPATAVAAIAAPLVPYAPAIAPPVAAAAAPVLPAAAAPAPAIPSSGPDSDVEVVEARSGPLVAAGAIPREEQLRRQQEQQLQQLKQLEKQQQEQLQQLQQQSRLQQQQIQQQQRITQQRRGNEQEQERQQQQQRLQEQQPLSQSQGAPVKALASPVQLAPQPARLVAAKPLASYAAYPGAYAYTAAYTSPLAYAAPLGGLTYAPAPALL
ncbi:hypothetical protein K0M31_000095 [Melipona bicolor]|uniref:Larval cuticle protein A1A n=1 Tax=Melipona bicolor TaxID=60889 RepID=A0AA40GCT4_9HYME|nr:hypothetical protein K0M31_000095 [Melipona bicolor]